MQFPSRLQAGSVVDDASEGLQRAREARRANLQALRETMQKWARDMYAAGASDTKEPNILRNRRVGPLYGAQSRPFYTAVRLASVDVAGCCNIGSMRCEPPRLLFST